MKQLLFFAFLQFLLSPLSLNAKELKVLVTLKPLHSLVSAVMENVAEPELLLKLNSSPHSYTLRPSNARMLQDADIIFWGGKTIETFLIIPLQSLAKKAIKISFLNAKNILLLPVREGQNWQPHEHEQEMDHEEHDQEQEMDHEEHDQEQEMDHEEHDQEQDISKHEFIDPHLWLDPLNAIIMVDYVTEVLSQNDPVHASEYRRNQKLITKKLSELDEHLKMKLAPIMEQPYMVFHDGFQYFEKRYQLNSVGSVLINLQHSSSVRRLKEVQLALRKQNVVCIFTEPQFSSKLMKNLISGTSVKTGTLDPIGANLVPGTELYFKLMNQLAASIEKCLVP